MRQVFELVGQSFPLRYKTDRPHQDMCPSRQQYLNEHTPVHQRGQMSVKMRLHYTHRHIEDLNLELQFFINYHIFLVYLCYLNRPAGMVQSFSYAT